MIAGKPTSRFRFAVLGPLDCAIPPTILRLEEDLDNVSFWDGQSAFVRAVVVIEDAGEQRFWIDLSHVDLVQTEWSCEC